MSSKQLDSILNKAPAATVGDEIKNSDKSFIKKQKSAERAKIVARVPFSLKEEIREYIKNNKEDTESTLVLKGLKKLGFTVDPIWTIDGRKLR